MYNAEDIFNECITPFATVVQIYELVYFFIHFTYISPFPKKALDFYVSVVHVF